MKKLITCLMTIIMITGFVLPTNASQGEFVPSITYKEAPSIVVIENEELEDGTTKSIIGYVKDKDGNILSTEYEGCLIITSLEEALNEESEIDDSIRNILTTLYNDFWKGKIKLSEINEELNSVVTTTFGENKNADLLVIKDLFYAKAYCEELNTYLPPEETTIDLTFDVNIPEDGFVTVLTYVDDEWRLAEKVVNNNENSIKEDDGTITVTFEELCPIMILVPGSENVANYSWWILVILLLLILCAVYKYVNYKKSQKLTQPVQ